MNDMFNYKYILPVFNFDFYETETTMGADTELAVAIPEVWANRIVQSILTKSGLISAVNRDYENEVAEMGDTVNITKTGLLAAVPKVANTRVTYQNPSATQIQVLLSHHEIVPFMIEDIAASQAIPGVMDAYINDAVNALVNKIEASIAEEYANATYTEDWDDSSDDTKYTSILAARTDLRVTEKLPNDVPTYLVVRDEAELLTVTNFIDAATISGRPVETGEVGEIAGFKVKESSEINTVVSPSGTHRMAFAKDAITLATRPLRMAAANLGARSAVIQKDGISVRVVFAWDPGYVSVVCTVDVLWGVKTVRPEHLVDLYEGN